MKFIFLALSTLTLSSAFAKTMDMQFALKGSKPGVRITKYRKAGSPDHSREVQDSSFVVIPELEMDGDSMVLDGVECAYLKDLQFFHIKLVKETRRCEIGMVNEVVSVRVR